MSDKSPTERVREMLDERGISWVELRDGKTAFESPILGVRVSLTECDSGFLVSAGYKALPPEQAIAATVGGISETKYQMALDDARKARMDAEMWERIAHDHNSLCVSLRETNADLRRIIDELKAATVGAGTCHMEVCDNLDESEGTGDVWLECDKCHWQMMLEPTTPRFKYCPHCRARIKEDEGRSDGLG